MAELDPKSLGLMSLEEMVSPQGLAGQQEPLRYSLPLGFEVFVAQLARPTANDLVALLSNPAWQMFMQLVKAQAYDMKVNRGFDADARKNDVDLLLSEGLCMIFEIYQRLEREIFGDDDESSAAPDQPAKDE